MPGKWVATFVFGSQRLYDFIDENPLIYMCGTDMVNNPRIACLNDNLMSINTTIEVDLTGQCASESMAYRQYTGLGGQLDFVRASAMSKGVSHLSALIQLIPIRKANCSPKSFLH